MRSRTTPFEEGNSEARICILGESPARTEMRLSRPLVGPSGQLLDHCMHAAGMVRRECYILNVFPFPVRKTKGGDQIYRESDGELLWTKRSGLTEYGADQAEKCLNKIRASECNVVIPLGGTALSVVYPESAIMKWRGSILWSSTLNKKIVPTIHPAAALRGQYLYRYPMTNDLSKAKRESSTSLMPENTYELFISPSFQETMDFLSSCSSLTKVAFDIEVLNHQVSCFSLATDRNTAISIPLVEEGGKHMWTESQETLIWQELADILGDPSIGTIGQNLIFDISFMLQQNNIHTRGPIYDTMVAHHIIWPDFPKGLDFLCSMHTDHPYYKDDGKLWRKPWADLDAFWRYNALDSLVSYDIWEAILPELEKGYMEAYQQTVDMFPALIYMMTRGFKVNQDSLKETKKRVESKLDIAMKKLKECAEWEFNPASPKQCIEYFYGTKGIKPYINRKTSRPTTDDQAMSRIVRRYNLPEARLVQEIRGLKKLLGTYLEVGMDKDDRIRCSYNPRGTTTGRLSSSQTIFGTGMNMQNLHPEFKGFLVSD